LLGAAIEATGKKGKGKREIDATPVIKDGTIYVGSKDHSFYALDAKTGKLKWATDIGHPIFQEALVSGENIIVHGIGMGLSPSIVYMLRKKDGQLMWSTEGKGSATYPFSNGKVAYFGLLDNKRSPIFFLNAVELNTEKLLWTRELQGKPSERVYGSVNLVYVSAFKGGGLVFKSGKSTIEPKATYVYAVNASTGKLVWEFMGGESWFLSPPLLIESKNIFFTTTEGLYALDKNTGKQDWFIEGKFSPHNITIDNLLYVHGDSMRKDNRFYAINPKTGKVIWSHRDKNIFNTKVVGNTVYISAEQGLVALNSATGKKLWKFKTGGFFKPGTSVSASPLIFENHVIFPTGTNMIWGEDDIQGHLYSIDARTGKDN
jgi:outer membrane protein assembly factor BamB